MNPAPKLSTKGLLKLLGELVPMRVTKWADDSKTTNQAEDTREPAEIFNGANVITSRRESNYLWRRAEQHAVLLDLDVPAYLVPSSTPGHSHLYIDVHVDEDDYFDLLDQLAKCNVIDEGYAKASRKKGATFLRLPWVKKWDTA